MGKTVRGRLELSLVLPVYNEGDILRNNVRKLKSLLGKLGVSYEIMICDDCSTDGTQKEAWSLSEEDPRIAYLRFSQRIGKGGTIKNAIKIATGEAVMTMDADVPVTHRDLKKMLEQMKKGFKLVITVRKSRPTTGVVRKVLSIAYNTLVRLLFGTGIMDHQCGLKVLATDLAREVLPKIRGDGFILDTELIVHVKRRKVPVGKVHVDWVENRPLGLSTIILLRAILPLLADLMILRVGQIMHKRLLMYKEMERGEFIDHRFKKRHKATGLIIDVRDQRLLEILRKIYLVVAFGRNR